ncbi:MAG: hypothetical protein JRG68_00585 [Deltaproteobacteria bacterium]|nr:hypothetical protein [Deltaproteobacteria bacterium]MBW2010187.1 hypothetical protein [Deltaproteobacteria bacterium]MBW2099261.1 hypothetical protein [Deltaproteobacteria bacterium]
MYDLVRGPLLWVSFIVFVLGTVFQIIKFMKLSKKIDVPKFIPASRSKPIATSPGFMLKFEMFKAAGIGTNLLMAVVTTVFHVCLFAIPIFLVGHSVLFDQSWGINMMPFLFSENTTDTLTIIFLACSLYFLLRRLLSARVRAITTSYDYVVLLIAAAPFLTGFFAYHQIFNYNTIIILHILFGELMLVTIPFTKLVHMVFFFINRFFVASENCLGEGNRTW